jgi:hypothetical protein
MPLRMSAKQTDKYFIVGLDDNNQPVALLPGQVVTVTSADPASVVIAPDATALPTDADYKLADGTLVAKGSVTQQSGTVSFGPSAVLNTAVNVTQSIKNADGTPVKDDTGAVIADQTDTVTLIAGPGGVLKKEGELFGTPA